VNAELAGNLNPSAVTDRRYNPTPDFDGDFVMEWVTALIQI